MSTQREPPTVFQRPWAIGVYLSFTALFSFAFSAPLASAIGTTTGKYPRGDAELFDPGALMLIEAARHLRDAMPAVSTAWMVLAVAAFFLSFLVIGFCLALLGTPGRARPSWAVARAFRTFPTLIFIAIVAALAAGVSGALVWIPGMAIARASEPTPPGSDIARYIVFGVLLLVIALVGILHDLARVAAAAVGHRTYGALRAALRTAQKHSLRTLGAYTWRTVLALGIFAFSVWLGVRVGYRTSAAVWATALIHQTALALMGLMRLSWLSRATRLVLSVENGVR
ncbi:MAG: hypothetical protein IPK82_13740 [Polyangiaceae bacterium]|nr:hypothetical protein [Polyangiaceae bacterium]